MAKLSKGRRKRGDIPIEPITFLELTESFKEKVKERESCLRAAGLWEFVSNMEIPWPWAVNISEFVITTCVSNFQHIVVRGQPVKFDVEAIVRVTTLPRLDNTPVAEATRAIDAHEWVVAFEDGPLAFDVKKQGWDLHKALPPWREWLTLIHHQIELEREGKFQEHCIVCAAFAAWFRGTRFNWAGEIRVKIQEEIERNRSKTLVSLRSTRYLGMLCQSSIAPDPVWTTRRSVVPFLLKPLGFIKK